MLDIVGCAGLCLATLATNLFCNRILPNLRPLMHEQGAHYGFSDPAHA